MRVGWVLNIPPKWSGGIRLSMELAEVLSKKIDLTIISSNDSPFLAGRGVKRIAIGPLLGSDTRSFILGPFFAMRNVSQLKEVLSDFDVVLANFPANLVAPFAHNKVLYFCYEPYQRFYDPLFIASLPPWERIYIGLPRPYYVALDKVASARLHTIMTIDNYTVGDIRRVYHRGAVVVGEGIDERFFRRTSDSELAERFRGRQVVFMLAKDMSPQTGVYHLLAAMSLVAKTSPQALLLLATTAPQERREKFLQTTQGWGLSQNVSLEGFIPDSMLPAYYSVASVAVHPYFFHNSILMNKEAMSCETPIVAWNGRAAEDVGDSGCGILVKEGSVQGLASAILKVLTDSQLASSMGKEGRARVLERFTLEKVADRVIGVCENAHRGRPPV